MDGMESEANLLLEAPPTEVPPVEPPLDVDHPAPPPEPPVAPPEPPATAPTPPRPSWLGRTAAAVAVALVAGATGAGMAIAFDDDDTVLRTVSADGTPVRAFDLSGEALDVAGVVAKAGPSVVSIQTQIGGRFGAGSAAGTGVVISDEGEIVTNAHVVEGATAIRVTLPGQAQSIEAELIGADSAADLALIDIDGVDGLVPAELGDSDQLVVGDDVVAIGNALALRGGPTVTRGIVSALDRTLSTGSSTMTGLIQTDASISSGNSGGALVDAAGRVIGINTAVATSSGGTSAENIGFAIAIDSAMPVVERLRSGGKAADAGFLGIRVSDPTDGSRGATVVSVESGSPADDAGLEAGDLITAVGDHTVDGSAALTAAVRSHGPGETVEITVVRDGDERVLEATLGRAGT
jgi:putative serine protease PepD